MRPSYRNILATSLLALSIGLIACSMDTPTSSTPSSPGQPTSNQPSPIANAETLTVEGRIVAVMESWPLQLTVETDAGQYHVSLSPETTIVRGGESVMPGVLSNDLSVRVRGLSDRPNTLNAIAIEVLQ